MCFEECAKELRIQREKERMQTLNGALLRGIRERSHEEAVLALYKGLTFVGGISDLRGEKSARFGQELVF